MKAVLLNMLLQQCRVVLADNIFLLPGVYACVFFLVRV